MRMVANGAGVSDSTVGENDGTVEGKKDLGGGCMNSRDSAARDSYIG